jgi:hypothetical protein
VRSRTTTRTFGLGPRVGTVGIEFAQQIVHLVDAGHERHAGPPIAAHGITLEVPSHVLANVSTRVFFALEKLGEELGVTTQRVTHLSQRGHDDACVNLLTGATPHGDLEVREQPRAAQTTPSHNNAVATRLVHHANRVVTRPDIAVPQDRHV